MRRLIVLNGRSSASSLSTLRRKVFDHADQVFIRNAAPKMVKVCDEKGKELYVIQRTLTTQAEQGEPKTEAQGRTRSGGEIAEILG